MRERLLVGRAARAQFLPLTDYAEGVLKKLLPFDAVMLGMGPDGHIASLIPGGPVMGHAMDPAGAALTAEIRRRGSVTRRSPASRSPWRRCYKAGPSSS